MKSNVNLILDNLGIVYSLASFYYKKFGGIIEFDELKSVGILGIVKALDTYKTNMDCKFTTYAYSCVKNEILYYYRKNKKYLNNYFLEDEIKEGIKFVDRLSSDTNIEDDVNNKLIVNKLYEYIDELDKYERLIMKYHLKGINQNKIAKILNLSQSKVSLLYNKAINKLRYKFLRDRENEL